MASVFWQFLRLGCISFGGPAAHVGYFHHRFVERLHWLGAQEYSQLLSLSQVLPGPGSSQLGFAIGLHRAGLPGGIAAFIGFTLPSFVLMYVLAVYSLSLGSNALFAAIVQGLKLLAVVVVADACLAMYQKFCQQRLAIAIAALTAISLWLLPGFVTQVLVLLFAALLGQRWGKAAASSLASNSTPDPARPGWLSLGLFMLLLFALPLVAGQWGGVRLFNEFYQSGSLVFGGGHVVLPLLQQLLGDAISTDQFLLGYAAAQAIPGPMFSLASFLGATLSPQSPLLGAGIATLGIFLPGFLLVLGLKNTWQSLLAKPAVQGAVWGINAAVVGLLLAALYQPVFISAVHSPLHMALVVAGLFALRVLHAPILLLVVGFAGAGLVS
ncbi:MAG: chorismate-binding protein [Gammaproteobacteria bacterium]|nr:MAG: chorismate-binding protein [Gammaproteobacteria bacterium]